MKITILSIEHIHDSSQAKAIYTAGSNKKEISFDYTSGNIFANAVDAIKNVDPQATFEDVPICDISQIEKKAKLTCLETEYQAEKAKLEGYFNTTLLMDDTDTQEELKAEMADLADWYEEEKKSIEGSAE